MNLYCLQWGAICASTAYAAAQVPTDLRGTYEIAIGDTSVQSAALADGTAFVQLVAEADCFVAIGTNPDASSGARIPLFSGIPVYVGRPNVAVCKIAVIERVAA